MATIHGENAESLASIMEYIQLPNHPFYHLAKKKADAFVEAERQKRIERGRLAMQEQLDREGETVVQRIRRETKGQNDEPKSMC